MPSLKLDADRPPNGKKILRGQALYRALPLPKDGPWLNYFDSSDARVPGFLLRASALGAFAFYQTYSVVVRKDLKSTVQADDGSVVEQSEPADVRVTRWMKIGPAVGPNALSLGQARTRAKAVLGRVANGEDPSAERKAARKAGAKAQRVSRDFPTVAALLARYVAARKAKRSPVTLSEYERMLKSRIEDTAFGKTRARMVRKADVDEFLAGIAADGRGGRPAPAMANRVWAFVRAGFAWAVKTDLLDKNTADVERPAVEVGIPRERRALTDAQVVELWRALDTMKNPAEAAYVKVMLLTAARRTEAACIRWEDFDVESKAPVLLLRAETRKGKHGRRRDLRVPLSPLAVAVFKTLREVTGNGPFCFPGSEDGHFRTDSSGLDYRLGKVVSFPWSPHRLRATAASGIGTLGFSGFLQSVVLGHASLPDMGAATPDYDASDRLGPHREALAAWGLHVAKLLGLSPKGSVGSVLAFGRRSK